MELRASAPGKLFVLGEYAVTTGGPAVICATERRLHCRLERVDGTPGLLVRRAGREFPVDLSCDDPRAVEDDVRFAAAAFLVAARRFGIAQGSWVLHPEETLDGDEPKWGLGGSAAVAAAVVALVAAASGSTPARDPSTCAGLARSAHRLAQRSGSGADVVASSFGGLVFLGSEDLGPVPTSCAEAAQAAAVAGVEQLVVPAGWRLSAHYSGRAARSGPRVLGYQRALRGEGPLGAGAAAGVVCWNELMREAALGFSHAVQGGRGEDAGRHMSAGRFLFHVLPRLTGVPAWSPGLRALDRMARTIGVASKPSGAGGGDCAVQWVPTSHPEDLDAKIEAAGFPRVSLASGAPGAVAERS